MIEQTVHATADRLTMLVCGKNLIPPDLLRDGVHPDDAGHRLMAHTMGRELRQAMVRPPQ